MAISETDQYPDYPDSLRSPSRERHHDSRRASRTSLDSGVQVRPQTSRNLKWWDVASLTINKMVGTGIFTGPFLTLQATGSKPVTLVYWILGFIYTILSMWLYLEYCRDLPYTGGEMVYLDAVWKRPRLLVYTMYSFYFVFLYGSATNALQFGREVIIAANVNSKSVDPVRYSALYDVDRRLMCFLAVTITCFVCLLLYFSPSKSRLLNSLTAAGKVLLLVAVFIAGCIYVANQSEEAAPWSGSIPGLPGYKLGWSQGIILVFFSYHGWENATFVAGEIPDWRELRFGFVSGVAIVGTLYVAIATIVCVALPSNAALARDFENYMAVFFGGSYGAVQASAVLIALSAVGNMLSISYTCIQVKQVMGWANILPLSNLWRRTDLSRRMHLVFGKKPSTPNKALRKAVIVRKGTPEGGIILHFIFSIVQICVAQAITNTSLAVNIFGTILIYGRFIFEAAVGLGFALNFKPGKRGERELPDRDWDAPYAPAWFTRGRVGLIVLGTTIFLISAFIIIVDLLTHPGYWYGIVNFIVIAAGAAYWRFFVTCCSKLSTFTAIGIRILPQTHGVHDRNNALRQCSLCNRNSEEHRHREDGYIAYNGVEFLPSVAGRDMIERTRIFGELDEDYVWPSALSHTPLQLWPKGPEVSTSMQNGAQSVGGVRSLEETPAPERRYS